MRVELDLSPDHAAVYARAMRVLVDDRRPFLVGGAWALARLTGVCRHTKDLDLFVRPRDVDGVLTTLAAAGFRTEILSPVWLAKAWCDSLFIDIIFSSGNGLARVDEGWFTHAIDDEVLGVPVRYCPPEETIWSKAWIMERERFDGADVAHLLRAWGPTMDWTRLLDRFGEHWRVLLGHLVLFGYIYPHERARIPGWVMRELSRRLQAELELAPSPGNVCQGPLLSCTQYLPDVQLWGYHKPVVPDPELVNAEDVEDAVADPARGRR